MLRRRLHTNRNRKIRNATQSFPDNHVAIELNRHKYCY